MLMNSFSEKQEKSILPTELELKHWSFLSSIGKSTNKLSINNEVIRIVQSDAYAYKSVLETDDLIQGYDYRVKSPDSIEAKVERHPDLRFQSVFNDLLGIRIKCKEYLNEFPNYYRVVDLTSGKSKDDGYRAQHLYYKLDNYHYVIEVQLWSDKDYEFNLWTHSVTYKYSSDIHNLLRIRELYDKGKITTFEQFEQEVQNSVRF